MAAKRCAGDDGLAFFWHALIPASVIGAVLAKRARLGQRLRPPRETLGRWLPKPEGDVAAAAPPARYRWTDYAIAGFFLLGFLSMRILLASGRISAEMMQPTSAIFVVPLLIYSSIRWRYRNQLMLWLYATLYALHALLIFLGVPILFKGDWEPLNMLLPVCGYGMLSALVSHAYSRYALSRLKQLARLPEDAGTQAGGR